MKKPILEQSECLTIRQVKAAIPEDALSVVLEIGMQQIGVRGRLTNLQNGYRYCFLCPQCARPVESLYRRDFSLFCCRRCQGLLYASSLRMDLKTPVFA